MFRRWRRARLAAQPPPTPLPHRRPARRPRTSAASTCFELVNARLSRFIGPDGQWSLVRRTADDSDRIFQAMLTHQIAAEVTRAILEEREQVAVVVPAEEASLALSWTPAPLVMWADPVDLDADVDADVAEVADIAANVAAPTPRRRRPAA